MLYARCLLSSVFRPLSSGCCPLPAACCIPSAPCPLTYPHPCKWKEHYLALVENGNCRGKCPYSINWCPSGNPRWTLASFRARNEQFFARSRKSRNCAETYRGTSHKKFRRLTKRVRKRAVSGRKLTNHNISWIIRAT